jgi:alpha-mannosidase
MSDAEMFSREVLNLMSRTTGGSNARKAPMISSGSEMPVNRLRFSRPIVSALLLAIFLFSPGFQPAAFGQIKDVLELSGNTKGWFEGFRKNLGGNEFPYFTFRSDVSEGLLTRCTDGKMTIKWETAKLPPGWDQKEAGFLWIAAINLTTQPAMFDVYVNGVKRFEIPASERKNWRLKNDGGTLSFTMVQTDQYGDAHGYMSLSAPAAWLDKGKGQVISITGRAENENTWIIVFQADDALSYLHNSVENDAWMELDLEKEGDMINAGIQAPITMADKTVEYVSGNESNEVRLAAKDNQAVGEFSLPTSAMNKPFQMKDSHGEVFVIKSLGVDSRSTCLLDNSILVNESKNEGGRILITAQRSYMPKLVSDLVHLSESNLGHGKIYLMNSSHQDIAWMDSPQKCVIDRDTMLITPLIAKAQEDTSYRFDLEESLMLREYIERHPDRKDIIKELLSDGRISCGANFTQPYEDMYSGESLARQMYFGAKWLKDEFGYDATVYWSEDVPGRTPQMMQILSKAGVKYMMISRMEKGLYKWYSPDGSYVTMFSPGHYADAFTPLQKGFYDASGYLAANSLYFNKFYPSNTESPVLPVLSDWDMSPAKDYSRLIGEWDNIGERQLGNGDFVPVSLPKFRIATAPEFFKALLAAKPELKRISGERPDVWVYIHGPSHEKALKASREGDILLTQAEKFATANALVDDSFKDYPEAQLRKAWEAKVFPDHGWGGKHGDITDDTFRRKFDFARSVGKRILDQNLDELASKVRTDTKKGRPLVVFNSMNMERTDPVSVDVRFDKSQAADVRVFDARGTEMKTQLSDRVDYPDGSIMTAKIHFIAENVPPIGYKTFYMRSEKTNSTKAAVPFDGVAENRFYRIKFTDGGLASIFDKELNVELIDSKKFAAGEFFTMRSVGNGAGEFADIQQPDTTGFDRTGNYKTDWKMVESGPVYTTYEYRQPIRYAVVRERVRVYNEIKRIDFDTDLLNWQGVLYREFRMALPLEMTHAQVAYEVPFGTVEVGKGEIKGAAGERYTTPCKDVHPRGIENWISASDSNVGVTMSSSVAAADWIDPTDSSTTYPILQPILLASRKSCHPEGNEYLQTGNHSYRFSITSYRPGWLNGASFGRGANEPLIGVWADHRYSDASLPESISFFHTDSPFVQVSTVKKAEDRNAVIVRLVDLEGKDRVVNFESFKPIREARQTNLIETEEGPLPVARKSVEIKLGHNEIDTFELK